MSTWRPRLVSLSWSLLLLAAPVAMGVAAVVRVTQASYLQCSGSDVVATTYRLGQLVWLVALPVLCWICCIVVDVRWPADRLGLSRGEVLVRRSFISALPVLFYFWFSVRYFHLDAHGCVDGLPDWWPAFLPAR